MLKADLHLHSTASDGVLKPEDVLRAARASGLNVAALTDHDTFAGTDAVRETPAPEIITSVELSMADMHGLHILCYGTAEGSPLRERVRELAEKRLRRADRILKKLSGLGMPLDELRTEGTVGRPQIARAMIQKGYVRTLKEAFTLWIGSDGPAYVATERMDIREALPLILRSGFVPVLAHPYELNQGWETLVSLVDEWKELGLAGIEVYHPSARGRWDALGRLARQRGMLVTGGSDFHSPGDGRHGEIGSTADDWQSAEEDIAALREAMAKAAGS